MPERIKLESVQALIALAIKLVRLLNEIAIQQKHLHNLDAVVLGGQHDRRYVWRELRVVGARRLPERVGVAVEELFVIENPILRMHEYYFGNLRVSHEYGEQQSFTKLRTVRFGQQTLHNLFQF